MSIRRRGEKGYRFVRQNKKKLNKERNLKVKARAQCDLQSLWLTKVDSELYDFNTTLAYISL